jgi:hypothetical protein
MIGITFNGQLAADYGLTQERVSIDSDEGCEAPAKPAEPVDPEKLSGSLQEELTAQRTVAIRAEPLDADDWDAYIYDLAFCIEGKLGIHL